MGSWSLQPPVSIVWVSYLFLRSGRRGLCCLAVVMMDFCICMWPWVCHRFPVWGRLWGFLRTWCLVLFCVLSVRSLCTRWYLYLVSRRVRHVCLLLLGIWQTELFRFTMSASTEFPQKLPPEKHHLVLTVLPWVELRTCHTLAEISDKSGAIWYPRPPRPELETILDRNRKHKIFHWFHLGTIVVHQLCSNVC